MPRRLAGIHAPSGSAAFFAAAVNTWAYNTVVHGETMISDLRDAARNLVRMRSGAAVAILTLALGIGATTTMFSVVYAALLRPLPFADPDRLVMLHVLRTTPQDGLVRLRWSMPSALTLAASVSSFESVATVTSASIALSG